ncbi:MAG: ABC transporter ATP-binding protein, partial [Coprobacillus sp.]
MKKQNVIFRLLKMIFKDYWIHCIIVLICILLTALATVQGTLFMQVLIDDYIVPMIGNPNPDFVPLFNALLKVAAFFLLGVISAFTYNRIMVYVTQGFLKELRIELFEHMESLPIRYFDRTSHGDIMSVYTNDTDTLRQLISQSLPQLTSSAITIVTVFISMITLNLPLTGISLFMLGIMVFVSLKMGTLSGRYFVKQQNSIGKVNGYIEEMISGQKVVKVFNHEQKAIEDFRKLNEELRESANSANKFANVLMPVTVQTGNVSYIICAIVGAILALNGYAGLTIGTLVSFLTLNKNFNQPVGQISQQINSVAMAQAGAKRIFDL